jgi:6-phosphogluconate dehydrogenase
METACEFGVIGLGVMGSNLALNIEEHGFPVAIWNRHYGRTRDFLQQHRDKKFAGPEELADFVNQLARPRRILLLVKAGNPVDAMISQLLPQLSRADILIDGGNSYFKDTRQREQELRKAGIHFIGMGVSGGEEGARRGPSLMPGGAREAYEQVAPILEAIAARTESGACVAYIGPDGAGHFVKLIHNAIEYGIMQVLAESYDLLRRALNLDADAISSHFAQWNTGLLESFLVDLSATVLAVQDPETAQPLVDMVLDAAEQKGTGRWAAQEALELGVPVPTIMAALFARNISGMKSERETAGAILTGPDPAAYGGGQDDLVRAVHDALTASIICAYTEGLQLIATASREYQWHINLVETARIWKGGCIIRARLLDMIMAAYDRDPALSNLLLADNCRALVNRAQDGWRFAVRTAVGLGIPVPAMQASLAYYDSYRTGSLPQNLTQAQRDAFGAHTYRRKDRPDEGPLHTDWLKLAKERNIPEKHAHSRDNFQNSRGGGEDA